MKRLYLLALLGLLAFSGVGATPTNASFSSQVTVTGNTFSTGTWNTFQDAADNVKTALENNNSPDLYNLMSADFKALFSLSDFTSSFGSGPSIASVTYLDTTQTLGEGWHEQRAQVTFSDGVVTTYNLIFRLENGEWKLYATEEI